ncbi:MAG: hypothetical protein KC561_01315 [Myxococcales bacterium]|nr:hypothetical protein [Myxococcales bacterium]
MRSEVEVLPSDIGLSEVSERLLGVLSPDQPGLPRDFETLKAVVATAVKGLLHGSLAQLTQVLYRLDVSETTVAQIFEEATVESLHHDLADLMIEREIVRIRQLRAFEVY